jgi:CBS domain-containing protein
MLVREAMNTDLVTVTPDTLILEVAKRMALHNVGAVIVVNTEGSRQGESGAVEPAGIVTDRDLVLKHLAKGHDHECPVKEAMTPDRPVAGLVTIRPDMDLLDAAKELGRRHVGRLPVVEDGRIVGILSAGDVSKHLRDALDGLLGEGEKASNSKRDSSTGGPMSEKEGAPNVPVVGLPPSEPRRY